jgi:cytochrome bd-type quinol oxidase subunit 1
VAILTVGRNPVAVFGILRLVYALHFVAQEGAMTFLAIWFVVALVVGVLLGYAAGRLKRGPKARRAARNANTDEMSNRRKHALSRESSMKTSKLDA